MSMHSASSLTLFMWDHHFDAHPLASANIQGIIVNTRQRGESSRRRR